MSDKKNPSRTRAMHALTSAALAIPGLSAAGGTQAATVLTETVVEYKASAYREADLDSGKLGGGSAERYEIDSHQISVRTPLGERTEGGVEVMVETMSGASPWFILPGTEGQPVQVMSGATISEDRTDVQASVGHLVTDSVMVSVSGGFSEENDYFAVNGGVEVAVELDDKHLTLTGGLGFSDDELEPTDGRTMADRIISAEKDSTTGFVGLSRVLSPTTVVQGSLSYSEHNGFLSDPYKKFWVVDQSNTLNDARPTKREQFTAQARLRHFLPEIKAALHADYRYYDDDWEITSHTFDFAWYQNLPNDWMLVPSLRYYSQTQAFFYAPYFFSARADGFGSSDYRLSPYGALSVRLRLEKHWDAFGFHAEWEHYEASADYSLDEVDVENPGLVEFDILSLGVDLDF